jgi:hypothetical protein
MMQTLFMLAQSGTPGSAAPEQSIPSAFLGKLPIENIWQFILDLRYLESAVFIAFGIIYLIYGWRVFRVLVTINFAGVGMYLGIYLGDKLGSSLWGGIVGAVMLGTICWPFMKYSVSILGGFAGAILGGAIWRIIGLPEPLIWCGALTGLIAGGLLVFSSYKTSIMLFTSLQGSAFVVIGILALLSDYPNLGQHITDAIYAHLFLLPTLLIIPTVSGIFFQQRLLKRENDWAMPE